MKNYNLLLSAVFILNITSVSYGQELLTKGAAWTYEYGPSMSGRIGVVKLKYERDTTINTRSCKIISGKNTFAFISTPSDTSSTYIKYYLRENNDTLFYYDKFKNEFFTLYNFNGNVGDSWQWPTSDCPNNTDITIDSIGFKIINGDTLKTIEIYIDHEWYPSNEIVIEKVGPETGYFLLFQGLVCGTDRSYLGNLICYQDSMLGLYQVDSEIPCYYRFVSVNELEYNLIKTYPNPAQSTWHIQSEKNAVLEIYSLSGKEMLRRNIQSGTEQINISPFAEGIYFYRISSEKGELMKSGKLVMQR